jgi:hypothetical protein
MAVTWKVNSMDRDIAQGDKADVVTTIHWTASETDSDGNNGSSYGSVSVTLGSSSFVAYKDITEANAIAWAKHALGDQVAEIEANIASQIAAIKTPTTASGISW